MAYGVVINAVSAPQRQASLDEVTQAILQQLAQSNPDMKQAGNAQRISVNGAPAIVVPVTSTSPIRASGGQQVRERDLVATVQRQDGSILLLVFVAPEQDFGRLQSTYESMLNSLQVQ